MSYLVAIVVGLWSVFTPRFYCDHRYTASGSELDYVVGIRQGVWIGRRYCYSDWGGEAYYRPFLIVTPRREFLIDPEIEINLSIESSERGDF